MKYKLKITRYYIDLGNRDCPMRIHFNGTSQDEMSMLETMVIINLNVGVDWSDNRPKVKEERGAGGHITHAEIDYNITREQFALYAEYLKDWRDNREKVDLIVICSGESVWFKFIYNYKQ